MFKLMFIIVVIIMIILSNVESTKLTIGGPTGGAEFGNSLNVTDMMIFGEFRNGLITFITKISLLMYNYSYIAECAGEEYVELGVVKISTNHLYNITLYQVNEYDNCSPTGYYFGTNVWGGLSISQNGATSNIGCLSGQSVSSIDNLGPFTISGFIGCAFNEVSLNWNPVNCRHLFEPAYNGGLCDINESCQNITNIIYINTSESDQYCNISYSHQYANNSEYCNILNSCFDDHFITLNNNFDEAIIIGITLGSVILILIISNISTIYYMKKKMSSAINIDKEGV
jgi:hypothetical protein